MSVASRLVPKVRRLAHVMFREPHYVLGRFPLVRDAYSALNRLRDRLSGASPLRIGDLYKPATSPLAIAESGYVRPLKTTRQHVDEMRTLSYSPGPQLTAEAVASLRASATTTPMSLDSSDDAAYDLASMPAADRKRVAFASIENSSALPVVRALAGDPTLYEAASAFLGYRPRRVSSWLFWSFANELSADQRRAVHQTIDYHYDVDGMNFMYANFYLLDTTALNGAHALMAGSSRRKPLRCLLGSARLNDADARAIYGQQAERTLEGSAGFGFLEDASCYHKALPPQSGDRLMLQLRYQ